MNKEYTSTPDHYEPCAEFDCCNELIERYYTKGDYKACFEGHLAIAKTGYALAECQVGWFYSEGLGVEKDAEKAFYWTQRGAQHGDRDAQENLAEMYEQGTGTQANAEMARFWHTRAAENGHADAIAWLERNE